jgi:hypothetical protein
MLSRRSTWLSVALIFVLTLACSWQAFGRESHPYRGRKYKAPPPAAHIVVQVFKKENGKPLMNAAVVFNPFDKNGKDLGNLEVKTDPDGKAIIDIIPVGSRVEVQIIATGFATFAQNYQIDGPAKDITVSLLRPREQISAYEDNEGKAAIRKPGVQEPIRPKAPAQSAAPAASTSEPAQTSTSSSSTQKQ